MKYLHLPFEQVDVLRKPGAPLVPLRVVLEQAMVAFHEKCHAVDPRLAEGARKLGWIESGADVPHIRTRIKVQVHGAERKPSLLG